MTGHRDGGRKTSRGCVSPSEGGPGTPGGGVSASFKETAVKREKGDFIKERDSVSPDSPYSSTFWYPGILLLVSSLLFSSCDEAH